MNMDGFFYVTFWLYRILKCGGIAEYFKIGEETHDDSRLESLRDRSVWILQTFGIFKKSASFD